MKIEKGDKVKVHFRTDQGIVSMKGIVYYVPCATGDSWRIYATNGTINYVQEFTVMTKITWVDRAFTEQWTVSAIKKLFLREKQ
jgi:hypothetical protein